MITPPVGLNLFVTSGITGMSLAQVVKAAAPFVLCYLYFNFGDICALALHMVTYDANGS